MLLPIVTISLLTLSGSSAITCYGGSSDTNSSEFTDYYCPGRKECYVHLYTDTNGTDIVNKIDKGCIEDNSSLDFSEAMTCSQLLIRLPKFTNEHFSSGKICTCHQDFCNTADTSKISPIAFIISVVMLFFY